MGEVIETEQCGCGVFHAVGRSCGLLERLFSKLGLDKLVDSGRLALPPYVHYMGSVEDAPAEEAERPTLEWEPTVGGEG